MSNTASEKATAGEQLASNLSEALKVAGPQKNDRKPGALRSVVVQRITGIARSTLRSLKNNDPNPDLRTLSRIAEMLGIPVAFLLMRPEDWAAMLMAIDGMHYPLQAARSLDEDEFFKTEYIEKLLKRCGVHPDRPPIGASPDKREADRMEARNEWRRRTSHVMAALTRRAARDRPTQEMLAAFAASFVNQTTPNDPVKL